MIAEIGVLGGLSQLSIHELLFQLVMGRLGEHHRAEAAVLVLIDPGR